MLNIKIDKNSTQIIILHQEFEPKIPELIALLPKYPEYFSQQPRITPAEAVNNFPVHQQIPLIALHSKEEDNSKQKTEFVLFFKDKVIISFNQKSWKTDFVKCFLTDLLDINGSSFSINKVVITESTITPFSDNPTKTLKEHIGLTQKICEDDSLQDVGMALRYKNTFKDSSVLASFEVTTCFVENNRITDKEPNSLSISQTFVWDTGTERQIFLPEYLDYVKNLAHKKITGFAE